MRFPREPRQFVYLAVCTELLRAHEQADFPLGKFRDDLPDHRHRGVSVVIHRKQNLVVRVILPAKTRKIFVGSEVQAKHRFEHAHWRSEIGELPRALTPEKPQRRHCRKHIVAKRSQSQQEHCITPHRGVRHHAGLLVIDKRFASDALLRPL